MTNSFKSIYNGAYSYLVAMSFDRTKIKILQGDITDSGCEAIVNAANTELWLGSGVAGAIREKGGPSIQEECSAIGTIGLGEAVVTGAGNLQAKHIIHAASMSFDQDTTEESLYDAICNSLKRAEELQVKSIAFPAIGTGEAKFDTQRCAEIMLAEVVRQIPLLTHLEKVEIVLFDEKTKKIFETELANL